MRPTCAALLAAAAGVVAAAESQRPVCMMAESLVDSVDMHLADWDTQIDFGLNSSLNCSMFLEFVYLSRERIRNQLDYIRGNFTAEDDQFQAQGEQGQSTTWAMTHMSTAASLVSAHVHIHGVLAAARRECLSEHLQLLFLMSLKRLKALLHGQLRQLWVVFQGTSELFRRGVGRWLGEVLELFEADLRTMETIMASWEPPPHELEAEGANSSGAEAGSAENGTAPANATARPGPPLPSYAEREPDGALSTVEVLRRDAFDEWKVQKKLLRALLRYVLPRDSYVADMCAGSGLAANWLNDTGLVVAHAFDASPNIKLLSKGTVDYALVHTAPMSLWRSFDMAFCLTAASDLSVNADYWAQLWQNIEAHTTRGAILTCGTGEVRQQALGAAERHAPGMKYDMELSEHLDAAAGEPREGVCVFWRRPDA